MSSIGLLFVYILSINCQPKYDCDFDGGQKCLEGLATTPYILFNDTSDEPRQPVSDITAIETSNDVGECFFPFQLNSFQMFFCEKNDPGLPATCPMFNATGPRMNCSEGEYGYEKFEVGETGSRSYKLDLTSDFLPGEHCIRFYYYLSDETSNGSINIIVEDNRSNSNTTIVTISSQLQNKWYGMRKGFVLNDENPAIYFEFELGSVSNSSPFYMAVDQITIIDLECEPVTTTTTESSSTLTLSAVSTSLPTISTVSPISTTFVAPNTSTSSTTSTTTTLTSGTTSTAQSTTSSTSSTTSSTTTSAGTTSITNPTITPIPPTSTLTSPLPTTTNGSSSIKIRSNILFVILFFIFIIKLF